MSFPSPLDINKKLPLSPDTAMQIQKHRKQIQSIILGESPLWALVIGPCSLHDPVSALDYSRKLKALQEQVKTTCLLVMRAHIEKPRTCIGWKGLLYDPYLDGSDNIEAGLSICRSLYLQIANLGTPIATELLDPILAPYFSDLISWGFIGARTSSSQIHRQLASSLSIPIGFKNSTDGDLESAIQGALAAQNSQSFIHINELGRICPTRSLGNPFAHIVLRGSTFAPNYKSFDIQNALTLSKKSGLNHRLLVDCSHDNSYKNHMNQKDVCHNILNQCLSGNDRIMGIMIESHIKAGNQPITADSIDPFISITDPCINWEETEELVYLIHEALVDSNLLSSL